MSDTSLLIETIDLGKRYGQHQVLQGVNFELHAGESVAVIGENGAGKSTFAKIVTGVIRPDEGSILLDGQPATLRSPRDALRQGIAFIPQELAYVPYLTVGENVLLGQWPSTVGFTSTARTVRRAREECERIGIALDVDRLMVSLKLADRQIVEIVKALTRRARMIVLDEPTASLSEAESSGLFEILGQLTKTGVGVIYISHRMDEVYRFSDRVDVFRNGVLVASVPPSQTTPNDLIAHMLGQEKEEFHHHARAMAAEQPVVELRNWTRPGIPKLADVSLSVGRSEIVGIYGVRGSGAELVAEGLGGRHPEISGSLVIEGRPGRIFPSPLAARRANISYVPPERKRDGLVLMLPIQANLSLLIIRQLSRLGLLKTRAERASAAGLAQRFDVRFRRLSQAVGQLSGGNQQKILLASRMAAQPRLLVLQEPTRGVDVGARVGIHTFLTEIADQGRAVLLITSDVEEAVNVSDRLLIMRDGSVVGELSGSTKTQADAIALAAGRAGDVTAA
ncbi:MAG TPA: sugar ABC transporter ATP-binding protein [Thermomicrobiales bacterium]|nr:sugar ABC transporter ATP-binding protein [Thermomicrobiales bacterium]